MHSVEELIIQGEDAASVAQCGLSGLRQAQTAPILSKQRRAKFILEPLHLQADGRRSTTETVSGFRESAQVVGCGQRAQRVEIKAGKVHAILAGLARLQSRAQCGLSTNV